MRMKWLACAFVVAMGAVCGFADVTPATQPLVLPAAAGSLAGPHIAQLVGIDEIGEWNSVPLFVSETGMDAAMMAAIRWEVRSAETQAVVCDADLRIAGMVRGKPDGKPHGMNHAADFSRSPELAALPDGQYVAAFVVEGKRVSNVVTFARKAAHALVDEPLVRVIVSEPTTDSELPLVGVTAARRSAADPVLGPMDILAAELTIDGETYKAGATGYSGQGPPGVGGRMMLTQNLTGRGVVWDAAKQHVLKARVAGNDTAEVTVAPGMPLGAAWDAATSSGVARPPATRPGLRPGARG